MSTRCDPATKRNIIPELSGIVDSMSISLDAHDEQTYNTICKPTYKGAYQGMIDFIKEAKNYIPTITLTVVETNGVNLDKCKAIAEHVGARFRARRLDVVG